MDFDKKPVQADTLEAMFKADLGDEEEAIAFYTKAAQHTLGTGEIGSRKLFEQIALDEEGHKAWLELQLSLIERLGEAAFSAKYVSAAQTEEA